MNRYHRPCLFLLALFGATRFAAAGEPIKIDIYDQRVAIVNTEAISKRDVELRMGGAAERLLMFKKEKQAMNTWGPDSETEWTRLYVESFRDALRRIVRERLMLQHFNLDKIPFDEKVYQKKLSSKMKELRDEKIQFDVAELAKYMKESMMIEEFKGKFDNQLEFPKKPEVEAHYRANIEKYQRKSGAKIRVIRIDLSVEDKLTGIRKVRDNAYGMLEEIRRDIVEFGAMFSEVARNKTDDPELKERGGLVTGPLGDPYIVPDEYNKILAAATRDLKVGEVSKIFDYGGKSYAIAVVEDRREAGPIPLESKLYEQIYNEMYINKRIKKEDEWFRATLARTLVMQIVEGNAKSLPIDFFFPDDKEKDKKPPDFVAGQAQQPDGAAAAPKKNGKPEKK